MINAQKEASSETETAAKEIVTYQSKALTQARLINMQELSTLRNCVAMINHYHGAGAIAFLTTTLARRAALRGGEDTSDASRRLNELVNHLREAKELLGPAMISTDGNLQQLLTAISMLL